MEDLNDLTEEQLDLIVAAMNYVCLHGQNSFIEYLKNQGSIHTHETFFRNDNQLMLTKIRSFSQNREYNAAIARGEEY